MINLITNYSQGNAGEFCEFANDSCFLENNKCLNGGICAALTGTNSDEFKSVTAF
jgi:hypothetical protein